MMVLDKNGVSVAEGDLLFLYTGFADLILSMNKQPDGPTLATSCAVLDGRDDRLLQWITDSGVACVIADNYAVEQLPALPGKGERYANSPLHQHCLFKLGVPLGELWNLGELSTWLKENDRFRFFTTGQPLRLPGAVGSPANAVAVV
jgi:kynurenine formamidase